MTEPAGRRQTFVDRIAEEWDNPEDAMYDEEPAGRTCSRQHKAKRHAKPHICQRPEGHGGWHRDGEYEWPATTPARTTSRGDHA